jgi:molecular chaperone DnaK (HSP70)
LAEKRVFGIDLGTTFSCIAYVDENGKAVICKDADTNQHIVPSVVLFEEGGNIVVGQTAKESADQQDRIVAFVKRGMGTADAKWEFDGKSYGPEQISSLILERLRDNAAQDLSVDAEMVKDVVITCPAYFGDMERKATRAAGKFAKLNVLNVISEPTAAAIYYGSSAAEGITQETKAILVYDLGGGTFDVTLLSIKPGEIEEVCTKGNYQLGGKDWDEALADYLQSEFDAVNPGNGIAGDDYRSYNLRLEAEKAKKQLSTKETTKVIDGRDNVSITREKFDELTKTLLDETIELTKEVIEIAKTKNHDKVDEIILVGGSTRMPQVAAAIKANFNITPRSLDPDEAVAKGAALFANLLSERVRVKELLINQGIDTEKMELDKPLSEQPKEIQEAAAANPELRQELTLALRGKKNPLSNLTVKRITSKSFGVESVNIIYPDDPEYPGDTKYMDIPDDPDKGKMKVVISNLILAQSLIPAEEQKTFGTAGNGQTEIELKIYENEVYDEQNRTMEVVEDMELGRDIGDATITNLPPGLPKGTPVTVHFHLSDDGMLIVKGECQGKFVEATIQTASAISDKEIEEWQAAATSRKITG